MTVTVRVEGARELRAAFRDIEGPAGAKRLKEAHLEVSVMAAADATAAATGGTKLQQKMAGAIRPRATATVAGIALSRTGAFQASGVAFYGSQKRSGWFAQSKYNQYTGKDQGFPPWVGNTWKAATAGQGPHLINDAMAAHVDAYGERFRTAVLTAARDVGIEVI